MICRSELRGWRDLAVALYDSDTDRAVKALAALGYKTNQDGREAARSVHFMSFILRDTSAAARAREETKERMKEIKDREARRGNRPPRRASSKHHRHG